METLWQDIRYSARALLKHPGFTAVAVIALAPGIGANTAAIFSVINSMMLRPLPFSKPDRLLQIWEANFKRGRTEMPAAYPNFADRRGQKNVFKSNAISTCPRKRTSIKRNDELGSVDDELNRGLQFIVTSFRVHHSPGALMATLLLDIRHAFRMLRSNPGFTAIAIVALTNI